MPNLPPLPPPPQLQPPETPSWETPSSVWYTPRTTPWRTPQSTQSTPVGQMVLTKPATVRFNGLDAEPRKDRVILRQPRSSRTSLWIWCVAGLCFVFSLLLIFFAIATLIVFLAIRPRIPVFDIPNANLHTIYFDSPMFFNGDLSMLVNFTNPNKKIEVKFEKLRIELFFFNRLIAVQVVQPFSQKKRETRLEPIRLISSLVGLPVNHAVELKRQLENNKIEYEIRGTFKVRAHFGMIHYSYSLHGRCQLQMTGPPTGILISRNCTAKKR
ncbi:Late embryogenesis abundant protein LEA_2 subgroup [Arabidopsis thaliana x Arabidopsis arenosa]|uniref:Late embryogenesis abundant protein LEA_2 subgroup n=1 Tax=Arabidopsis thaliana x Arabidopsis arenosa TaxID=1240361 RepID=A0A8T1Y2Z8_9BRAS|nr:Late embryogenesis abundant protein LEA_2 subgroup [Arabidopsis thaliana x Arabidopsis arenosa]